MFGMFEVLYGYLTRMLGRNGESANAAGSLHAKSKAIYDFASRIGYSSDTDRSTLMGRTNSFVKSVQRGSTKMGYSSDTTTVNISPVNTAKSIVLLTTHGDLWQSGRDNRADQVYSAGVVSANLSSASITFRRGFKDWSDPYIYWQVIEFY